MRVSRTRGPGRGLELEIAALLKAAGFRTELNAGVARPRQTDLYARGHGVDLLVEVKDRKRSIDVADVDALRSRLRRTAADIVGVIFATSPITRGAISAIEGDRTREILVFPKDEMCAVREHRADMRALLERKRTELRVHGRAWFGPLSRSDYLEVPMPTTSLEFGGNETKVYFASRTSHSDVAFVLEIPDPTWGTASGEGVILPLRLSLSTPDDLRNILGYLHETFGLSSKGAFSIHQSEMSWHGAGANELLQAIAGWRTRYEGANFKYVHHSEDITYVDRLRDGWVMLSTRQAVHARTGNRDCYLHTSELAIGLGGVPLDSRPFFDLCRYTGNDWAQFQHATEQYSSTLRLRRKLTLEVVGTVVDESPFGELSGSDRSVVGVVAKNPFYRKKSLPDELQENRLGLRDLLATELLVCDLRDWHDEGDVIDKYVLEGVETASAYTARLVRPFGTWNRILERARRKGHKPLRRELNSLLKRLKLNRKT